MVEMARLCAPLGDQRAAPDRELRSKGSPPCFRNRLLGSLSANDLDLLRPDLVPVQLTLGQIFEESESPIQTICFPEDGFISVVAKGAGNRAIEAGVVGPEGMTGIALLLGDDRSPNDTYVQHVGSGHAMDAEALRSALRTSCSLRDRFLQYVHTFLVQVSQTVLANGRDRIDARLARWLLMADDRVEGPDMRITHEFLSLMLGVRRPGVTDALHWLEGERLIYARRGLISIRDRTALEAKAGGSYGVPEAIYTRLLATATVPAL